MRVKALLVVPHADDELFVGGGLLKVLAQDKKYECHVVYTTNGDYFPHEGETRFREALGVLTGEYGIGKNNIFFLGYGDGWKSERHLYNHADSQVLESVAGRKETYGIAGHDEYRQSKSGRHSAYCRENLKKDLKDLLRDIMADVIIAVDYDKHPDHKAASLMAEECIGELMIECADYRPLVLKRYAYDGVWKGEDDFFEIPRKRTILTYPEHFPYGEEDRICIGMPQECSTPRLGHNFLYRAAKCYKTQEVWQKADEIINIDEVYWKRNTDNLLFEAKLTASSGNAEYLRDFKLFDCGDVLRKDFVLGECAWFPAVSDMDRHVRIHFPHPRTVAQINLYAVGDERTDALAGEFVFGGGKRLAVEEICLNGKKNPLIFEAVYNVQDIDFYLTKCKGSPAGITEMEILPRRDGDVPEMLRDLLFRKDTLEYTAHNRRVMKCEKAAWMLHRRIWSWFPNHYFLKRRYPELCEDDSWIWFYRIKYFFSKLKEKILANS